MELHATNFSALDWTIVVAYLLGSIVIGVWANRYVGGLSDYLVAGRTLRIRLALATMTGTELGLVTVVYMSELGFTKQYASLYLAILEAMALLAVGVTGFLVVKLRATRVLTVPEFYEQRYSRGVRVLGGAIMVVSGVLNMGLFLKAGSQFVTAISGLADPISLKLMMTGLLLLVLFYTVLGGMISVVITDLIQFLVLGVGMLVVTAFVINAVGTDGLSAVVTQHNGFYDPTSLDNPSTPQPGDGIGFLEIAGQAAVIFTASMLWPTSASRTLSVKSPSVAKQLYLISTIPFLARRALPVLWGIGAFAFFASQPALNEALRHAIENNEGVSSLSAMPLFLGKIIPTGLLGIVTAGMIAAFMSTHDSYLLCWSGVITQDIVAPLSGPLSVKARILITRIAILAIGAVLLIWGLWYELESDLWNYMAITGTVYLAGVLPVVAGGLYWKRASSVGAYIALVSGLLGVLALDPLRLPLNEMTGRNIGYHHVVLATFVLAILGFVAGSLLVPNRSKPETT